MDRTEGPGTRVGPPRHRTADALGRATDAPDTRTHPTPKLHGEPGGKEEVGMVRTEDPSDRPRGRGGKKRPGTLTDDAPTARVPVRRALRIIDFATVEPGQRRRPKIAV